MKSWRKPFLVSGLGCILLLGRAAHTVLGQALTNDGCATAIALTNGVPYVMSTTSATSPGDPSDCVAGGKAVWFTYTPAADGLVVVDTCGSSFTTALGVYTNACASPVPLVCGDWDNGFCAGRQVVSFVGKATTSYHILAGGYYALGSGTLQITASSKRVSNDDCAGAIALTNGVPYVMSTTSATSPDPSDCVAGGKAVWFTYTPAADGLVVVDTCGSSFTTALGVYTNACASPVPLVCGDWDNGFCADRQVVSFLGKACITYWILVSGYYALDSGDLHIRLDGPAAVQAPMLGYTVVAQDPQTNLIVLCWPANFPCFRLEYATALPAPIWTPVSTPQIVVSGRYVVTEPMDDLRKFYRLSIPH